MNGGKVPGLIDRLRRWTWLVLARSRFYPQTLIGPVPANLRGRFTEPWPSDPNRGNAILAGDIEFNGELVNKPSPVWLPRGAGEEWTAEWNGFGWVADLLSTGAGGRVAAQALVEHWLAENRHWHPLIWRSDVVATRIFSWLVHFQELAGRQADLRLRREMLGSIARQTRHLARVAQWERQGESRLRAIKGAVAGVIAVIPSPRRIVRILRLLERELQAQLKGGMHLSRSPSVQLRVLQHLVDTRQLLRASHNDTPVVLHQAIERMAAMLQFLRHGDGRLALFNGSVEEDEALIDLVLARSNARRDGTIEAAQSDFQRLQAGVSVLLLDTGKPSPAGLDEHTYAGALSFEFSQGHNRIIVNSGGYRGPDPSRRRLVQASAEHSVLTVNDANSVEIDALHPGRSLEIHFERAAFRGQQWISATHDGYMRRFGLAYSRELYLASDGDDLRGEDKLTGSDGHAFAVHFHLHPTVEASLINNAAAARLRLPGGTVWRLRAAGAAISLAESIYLGSGRPEKTKQIVLRGTTGAGGANVRWAIRRDPER